MYHVGGNIFLNIQQMVPQIIREEMMSATYWEADQDLVRKGIAFVRKYCYVLSVRNSSLLTALRKLI